MDRANYTTVIDTPDIIHAQQMRNIVSQVGKINQSSESYKIYLLLAWLSLLYYAFVQQKKYREEAEKTMCHYVPVLDTPEMQRVRENQKNFSTVSNKCKWWIVLTLWGGIIGTPVWNQRMVSLYVSMSVVKYYIQYFILLNWYELWVVLSHLINSLRMKCLVSVFLTQSSTVCFTQAYKWKKLSS